MSRTLCALLCGIGLALAPLSAATALTFSDVFFFGASQNDTGNNGPDDADPSGNLSATFGYDPDRWTNAGGTMWTEPFAAALGFAGSAVASSDGGNNYAIGGNRADQVLDQIAAAGVDEGGMLPSTALYSIWSGGNDLLQGQDPASTVTDVINAINALSALGAERFLVLNMPDFSPLAPGTGPLAGSAPIPLNAGTWATSFNASLSASLAGLTGVTIFEYDVASVLNAILVDPVGNGFSEGLGLCSLDANCIAGIGTENFVLMDHIHLMSGPGDIIAAGALAAVPEPSTALLFGLGLAALGVGRRR